MNAVVVGRFQVPALTKGHQWLLDYAADNFDDFLVVLGDSGKIDNRNPLSVNIRRAMVSKYCTERGFVVRDIRGRADVPGQDVLWSASLDNLIEPYFGLKNVVMLGGRDSFIPHYQGRYTPELIYEWDCPTGTIEREIAGRSTRTTEDFRRGIIYAVRNYLT